MKWVEVFDGTFVAKPEAAPGEYMLAWPEQSMLAVSWFDTEAGDYRWIEPAKPDAIVKSGQLVDAVTKSWGFWVAFAVMDLEKEWKGLHGFAQYCRAAMKSGLEQLAMNEIGSGSRLTTVGKDLLILSAADVFNTELVAQKLKELYDARGIG